MTEKTLKLLEFDVVRGRAAACARSGEAEKRVLAEPPLADAGALARLKRGVRAIAERMNAGDAEPQGRLPDIAALLPMLKVEGAALGIEDAFAIGVFVREGGALLRWLGNIENADRLPDCADIEREVFRVLDKEGTLRDLPELRVIKRRIAAINRELQGISASFANNAALRRMLQSDVPVQRDGRLVIAVKHQFKGRIRGVVHEVSASGQTLFIEPSEILEKNNELFVERRRFDAEVRRILRELTANIAARADALSLFHESIVFIETLRARARYSHDTRGVFLPPESGVQAPSITPEITLKSTPKITLKGARHPLLGEKAVPIDILMTERVLIISGPNSGGKTAALKTIGLFALMNQFGLALPLAEGSVLPVFDGVFADIGDDQSLERSLSTFSAHISAVAAILKNAGPRSLVLLDELCAGTDPAEGSAIAMAVLDSLLEKNCFCIVTTHHGALKNYALANSRIENASVEFDAVTLSPAYRVLMGLPGESRALDISLRYGLPAETVNMARAYLDEGRGDVSALITGLIDKHRAAEKRLQEVALEERRLDEERRKADRRELRLRQKEAELKAASAGGLRGLLGESRKTLENLVRELREGELSREKTLKVKDFLLRLEETAAREKTELEDMTAELDGGNAAAEAADGAAAAVSAPDMPIEPGLAVFAGSKRFRGIVRRQAKKGFWVVEIGSVSMTFPEKELVPDTVQQKPPVAAAANIDYSLPASAAELELNLRGMRLPDAIDALQRQIDAALVSGLASFAIVHGKGDGVLQNGLHDYLKAQNAVSDYHFSRPELGGFGRTEVTLKTD